MFIFAFVFRLVVFDIDGTLIDTEKTGVESLRMTVRELLGKEISYEESYSSFGLPSRQVSSIYGYADEKMFSERWEERFIELSGMIAPFPGALDALKEIKEAGFMTGVVTSRNKMEFDYDIHLKAFLPWIDHVVCAEDAPRPKPWPDPLLKCMELASEASGQLVKPAETLFIGDTAHDFQCAVSAGCPFALADWKGRGWQGIKARYRFTSARGLRDILLGGNNYETSAYEL